MEMLQTFESTILSDSTDHAAHFLVVPERTFFTQDRPVLADSLIQSLGLVSFWCKRYFILEH
jgi:hypothetical protein